MKLTKLYIHNYKSFYDTTIELDKMNIVVGENNSGKSNLIDVLEFIDIAIGDNLIKAIEDKGDWEKILNYNNDEKKIIIEWEIESETFFRRSRLTFTREYWTNSTIHYKKFKDTLLPLSIISGRANIKLDKDNTRIYKFSDNMMKMSEVVNKLEDLKGYIDFSFPLSTTYAFNTETIRNKSHRKATIELKKDGSNLGKNLFHIKNNYPNTFELISNSMIGVVNEIDAVDVQETFGNYLIGFHEKNKQIGIDMVSDGTINLLATITALNQEDDKSILLAFDEPERYLHLKAINYLLENFRASEKQILITTHSTEILKYANLDEIVFIYRDADGDTQSIRANKIDALQDMLKELSYERDLTLDELIADGVIGDFKWE